MKMQLVRHATLIIEFHGKRILVDPMFASPGAYRSLTVGASVARNPTAPLPCPIESLLQPDILVVTHTHFDHFDLEAKARLSKTIPLVCQASDHPRLREAGFRELLPALSKPVEAQGVQFQRTRGQHGSGIVGRGMGRVSGFVLRAEKEPVVYIAGDTIDGPWVRAALEKHRPDVVILNAGAAQFNLGAPITMTAEDVIAVCRAAPQAVIVAVHMDAINHCRLSRSALAGRLEAAHLRERVRIPQDGEWLSV